MAAGAATGARMRMGVVGLGRIGRRHAHVIEQTQGLCLTAVCEPDKSVLHTAAFASPQVKRFADYEQLLDTHCCDMLVIATPSYLHYPMAMAALSNGYHLIVEKPVAGNAAEATRLAEAARTAGCYLTVYQTMRWYGDTLMVRDLLRSGALGKIFQVYRGQHAPGPPRSDWQVWRKFNGGLLYNTGTHLIDTVLHVSGQRPHSVLAFARLLRDHGDTEDHLKVIMTAADHVVLECEILRASQGKVFWHICGSNGTARVLDTLPVLTLEVKLFDGTAWSRSYDFAHERREFCMTSFYEALVDALATGKPMPVPMESVCRQMQVLDAARRSIRTGRLVATGIAPAAEVDQERA